MVVAGNRLVAPRQMEALSLTCSMTPQTGTLDGLEMLLLVGHDISYYLDSLAGSLGREAGSTVR